MLNVKIRYVIEKTKVFQWHDIENKITDTIDGDGGFLARFNRDR